MYIYNYLSKQLSRLYVVLKRKLNLKLKGFTLVELIIVIIILAILGTITFISLQGYSKKSRDTVRMYDTQNIKKALGIYIINTGKYPQPSNAKNITYSGAKLWSQGTFGDSAFKNVKLLNQKPIDPYSLNEYTYSVLANGYEYEIGAILESDDYYILNSLEKAYGAWKSEAVAYVEGNYNGLIARAIIGTYDYLLAVPSITLTDTQETDIIPIIDQHKLVYNDFGNLPETYKSSVFGNNTGFNYSTDNFLVYEGRISSLRETNNQIIFLDNLKKAYGGSILVNVNSVITKLANMEIDLVKPSHEATTFACSLITYTLKYFVNCEGSDFIRFYVTNILHFDISNLPGSQINIVFQNASDGDFWFGTNDGIARYSDGVWTIYQKDPQNENSLVNNNVTSISVDSDGNYWFGTVNGISKFDGESVWVTYTNNVLVSTHIQYIYTSADGTIWIGTNGGITTYNSEVWSEYIKKKDGISANNITTIFEDTNNNIWFGTNSKGVDKFSSGVITNYQVPDLPNNVLTYISQDEEGNIWFGTEGGIAKLSTDGVSWSQYTTTNTSGKLPSNKITYIYEDTTNNMRFGTNNGVVKVSNDFSTWKTYNKLTTPIPLEGNEIKSISQDLEGNILIISDGGINTINSSGVIID